MKLGKFIQHRRQKLNLTQKDITDTFGWSTCQFCSNWERNISDPPLAIAKKLARKLKIEPKVLRALYLADFKSKLDRYL